MRRTLPRPPGSLVSPRPPSRKTLVDAPVAARPALRDILSPTGGTASKQLYFAGSMAARGLPCAPTPLTSVIGYLELAREDETLGETTAGFLDVARRNADQLLIVQDLLADQVARSGTEKLRLRQRRIVVAHGAQIGARSMPGEGSTFTLRFPLEAPEAG